MNGVVQFAGYAQPLALLGRGHTVGHAAQLLHLQRRLQEERRLLPHQFGHGQVAVVEHLLVPAATQPQQTDGRAVGHQGHGHLDVAAGG